MAYDAHTLQLLKKFIVLARTGDAEETAKTFKTSVPQILAGMNMLERQVGCPLFKQTGKGRLLTPEGEQMLVEAHEILVEATPKTSKRHGGGS